MNNVSITTNEPMTITIVGMGLIGGSLALAIKNYATCAVNVIGFDSQHKSLCDAMAMGAVDSFTTDLAQAVTNTDVIFLCTPVLQIVPIVQQMVPYLKSGTIISDVASTKSALTESISTILPDSVYFVPGHPMAGSERSGMTAADKNLFNNKWYIFTASHAPAEVSAKLQEIISWTGARITTMNATDHDNYAAAVSHIPHIAAAALVNILEQYEDVDSVFKMLGGGFRDTTRIASSNADMWADICMTNQAPILAGIRDVEEQLECVKQAIRSNDRETLYNFFYRAKLTRDGLISVLL